ncbi:arylamine N-acetyltransferase family protein [Kitasatospora sp. NPDC054939]
MLNAVDVDRYLARLGVARPAAPSLAVLRALHAAHVERVPYEALEIQLGRPTSVDPQEAVGRLLRGRGGYCFHLNGAFAALLEALGYRVSRHVGGVHGDLATPAPGASANHLTLTVPCEGGVWLVDVGLGDALHQPLPLRAGRYRQGPFELGLRPSEAVPGGWRLDHDPHGAFAGMDFAPEAVGMEAFAEKHAWLSTAPESPFRRILIAQRRDARGVDVLRGAVLTRVEGAGPVKEVELGTPEEWFGALRGIFGLSLAEVPREDLAALWQRVHAEHLAWRAERAAGEPAARP